jgi:hypothetical protein
MAPCELDEGDLIPTKAFPKPWAFRWRNANDPEAQDDRYGGCRDPQGEWPQRTKISGARRICCSSGPSNVDNHSLSTLRRGRSKTKGPVFRYEVIQGRLLAGRKHAAHGCRRPGKDQDPQDVAPLVRQVSVL